MVATPVKGDDMAWLRQLLDWQREAADPGDFMDSLRYDLHSTEVFVFTPKGDVVSLPAGATPVDFAYAVHTEVGHRCIGARVNGRLVPLESSLDNGDVVEVFTSKAETAHPSQDWLQFVKSPRARNKIKQWFAKERREDAVESGKDALARAVRKQGLPLQRLLAGEALPNVAKDLHLTDVTSLYVEIGEGRVSAQSVVQKIMAGLGGTEGAVEDLAETATPSPARNKPRPVGDPGIVVKGVSDVWVKLARCCTPVPGDDVVGFVTRGRGVSVHRGDCVNAGPLLAEQDRVVEVEWAPTAGSMFLVAIQVEALDRTRLLSDVTRMLSDAHVSILSATVTTTRDRVAVSRLHLRDGRSQAPGPSARAGAQRRGRLRRLPRHLVAGHRCGACGPPARDGTAEPPRCVSGGGSAADRRSGAHLAHAEQQHLSLQVVVHVLARDEPVEQVVGVVGVDREHHLGRPVVQDELEEVRRGLTGPGQRQVRLPVGHLADLDVRPADVAGTGSLLRAALAHRAADLSLGPAGSSGAALPTCRPLTETRPKWDIDGTVRPATCRGRHIRMPRAASTRVIAAAAEPSLLAHHGRRRAHVVDHLRRPERDDSHGVGRQAEQPRDVAARRDHGGGGGRREGAHGHDGPAADARAAASQDVAHDVLGGQPVHVRHGPVAGGSPQLRHQREARDGVGCGREGERGPAGRGSREVLGEDGRAGTAQEADAAGGRHHAGLEDRRGRAGAQLEDPAAAC
jgi:hypothetical protein